MRASVTLLVLSIAVGCERSTGPAPSGGASQVVEKGASPASTWGPQWPLRARLLVVTGLSGTTEPCGCTSRPLGGLDKLAARSEAVRVQAAAAGAATGLVVVGGTFFERPPAGDRELVELAKARVVAGVLAGMKPLLLVPGGLDLAARRPTTAELVDANSLTALPAVGGSEEIAARTFTLGTVRIGVVAAGAGGKEKVGAAIDALRKDGVDLVLAAVPLAFATVSDWSGLRKADVVITEGGEEVREPHPGSPLFVESGDRGRFLGILDLYGDGSGAWQYNDGGRAARHAVDVRAERLRREIAQLDEGPARTARREKLLKLEESLAGERGTQPTGKFLAWRAEPITQDLPAAGWASERLRVYNRSLCDLASRVERPCPSTSNPAEVYAGSRVCQGCHEAAFGVYQRTEHAHAWQTLLDRGKECDPGCIGCHTVGYEQPGGFCATRQAANYANVGCESCHGPGAGHARAPYDRSKWSSLFKRDVGADTCAGCHNHEHSDLFQFATYLPRILGSGHRARQVTPQ